MEFLRSSTRESGVYYLSAYSDTFEKAYLEARSREGRFLSDELVRTLPFPPSDFKFKDEWVLRSFTFHKIFKYLKGKHFQSGLDLGCGNGWFSNKLRSEVGKVAGLDMNRRELEQASRVFADSNLAFIYADIFEASLPLSHFDLITLNASIQYFPDFSMLLNRLFEILAPGGEIHVIDSPWYAGSEIPTARERTALYYEQLGTPHMAAYYHHRSWEELEGLNWQLLYRPDSLLNKVRRKYNLASGFPWIRISSE